VISEQFPIGQIYVSAVYVRQLEAAPEGEGTLITVADQAATRHVRESIETVIALLEEGTVRYA